MQAKNTNYEEIGQFVPIANHTIQGPLVQTVCRKGKWNERKKKDAIHLEKRV